MSSIPELASIVLKGEDTLKYWWLINNSLVVPAWRKSLYNVYGSLAHTA
jgi:hypothetical protein